MILMGSSHHEDIESFSSIMINKLRHRTSQSNEMSDIAESALQYEFVIPVTSSANEEGQKFKESSDADKSLHRSTMMPKILLAINSSEKAKSLESFEKSQPIDSSVMIEPQISLMLSLVEATYSKHIEKETQS